MLQYEPYHVHTSYSNCLTQPDSTMSIEDYAKVYKERGHHVLCISEHGNRSNVWQQFELAKKYSDENFKMTPLAAAETYFVPDRTTKEHRGYHLILIAKNMDGYYQLNEILSEANLTGFYYHARVDFELLRRLNYRNFLCTTACVAGPDTEEIVVELQNVFRENFYLEVQAHPQQIQIDRNKWMVELSKKYRWPLIFATDSHYIYKEEKELRTELMLSKGINYGAEDEFLLYLPTGEEAYQMFRDQGVLNRAQIQEAMENTLILREFEGVSFTTEKKIPNAYPELPLDRRNFLYKKLCCDEYIKKAGMPTKEEAKEIHDEMDAVADTGTSDYFLIAKRVVDKGVENGGVITPTGRGSGSSFCTNFSLGFTTLNRLHSPVRLYPERFISRERMASGILPDLDLNLTNVEAFERAGKEILGDYGCLPMIAYGTAKTLSAFKLLAKARNIDFETANTVSKQIQNYELDVKHAIENNADDPDYNVDDDVDIGSYVEEKYFDLIEDSKQYKGIVVSWSVHPCAHLLLDRDIRREIGVVKVKDFYCAYIDGATADAYGYLKLDFLTVTVVKIVSEAFKEIGLPMMTVNELLDKCKDDKDVWDLYAKGFTQGLNQCEQPKSTERVMRYKPKNIVELAAFVAGIRPGFKSMLETFISRTPFAYNIPSLDKLLQTKEIPSSFLMYDEQVLSVLIAAGIPAADAYVCLKAIKKKKAEKVAPFKKLFKDGFSEHLQKDEGKTEKEAEKVCDQILKILEDSASYLFNASHALCVACDSLYVAWLKAHYPYELYLTMLKIWDQKHNKDKTAAVISEMKRYKNIDVTAGRFGQDNRDWVVDKEHHAISQSLSSIRYMSKKAANDLYKLGCLKKTTEEDMMAVLNDKSVEHTKLVSYDTFTDVLRDIQMNTCLDTRQIRILIELNYFEQFGKSGKLIKVYENFFEGEKKLTKTIKSFEPRLEASRKFEASLPEEELDIGVRLASELSNVGLCMSVDKTQPADIYFVRELDAKYGVKAKLYSVQRGTTGVVRFRKDDFARRSFEEGDCIRLIEYNKSPRYTYKGGEKAVIPGEFDIWARKYSVAPKRN